MILHSFIFYLISLHGIACHFIALYGIAWYCIVFGFFARYRTVMYRCYSAGELPRSASSHFGRNMIETVHMPALGSPETTKNNILMSGVVIFVFDMLGLVNFDKRKCYVLFVKQEKIYLSTPGPARAHRQCLSVGGCTHIWLRNVRFSSV